MRNLLDQIRSVYDGYRGDREPHAFRILCAFVASVALALDRSGLNKDTLATMAVIVSVLAGFSFTALFSSHSHSTSDLPTALSESDRQDIRNLMTLFKNFRDRARYFLTVSVICLLTVFFLGITLNFSNSMIISPYLEYISKLLHMQDVWSFLCMVSRVLALFMFFEILYTFYRLAQTVFAILDTRRAYLQSHD